jgi:hypothetical protein
MPMPIEDTFDPLRAIHFTSNSSQGVLGTEYIKAGFTSGI